MSIAGLGVNVVSRVGISAGAVVAIAGAVVIASFGVASSQAVRRAPAPEPIVVLRPVNTVDWPTREPEIPISESAFAIAHAFADKLWMIAGMGTGIAPWRGRVKQGQWYNPPRTHVSARWAPYPPPSPA